ncbi:AAA family ATPase [Pseudomonas aeruginosa]
MTGREPVLLSLVVRVTSIRSANKRGCIAFGHRVDIDRGVNDRSKPVVIRVPAGIAKLVEIAVGGIFEVYGEVSLVRRDIGSHVINESTVDAQDVRLVRPSGAQIIQWISDNVKGIGEVKATRLWDHLGQRLYDALDGADHSAIEPIIPSASVRDGLFGSWAKDGDAKTLRFVQEKAIPLELARKVIRFHKKNTVSALISDPYRLLSFSGDWAQVDEIARTRFGIVEDDSRRLAAGLEEGLYRASDSGHTCSTLNDLHAVFSRLLGDRLSSRSLSQALLQGRESGQFVCREDAKGEVVLHAPGAWLMERGCAGFITSLIRTPESQIPLFQIDVEAELRKFESDERTRLELPGFELNAAQRQAVRRSFGSRISIITGGAGVGKTTVLKALYRVLDLTGRPRFQMALSGRATARMIEATGCEARTIAGFLMHASDDDLGPAPVIVIDEASMVDLVTFHRLVQKLPPQSQLILIGDPYQLPPIGAGLVLHELCSIPSLPCTELIDVKRQSKDSAIPVAAKLIRQGRYPAFAINEDDEVVFIDCPDESIISTAMRLYQLDMPSSQILCATRSCRYAGMESINRHAHQQYARHDQQLVCLNPLSGELEQTGLCVDDLVVYTANDWRRNLQNGSLGRITEVYPEPRKVKVGSDDEPEFIEALGRAVFEGAEQFLLERDIDALEYAFAITVHKAQGSQFKRVIVPVRRSKILDRTFVYTALTRAQVQVIFVGDSAAVRDAIERAPKAFSRRTALRELVERGLAGA